MSSRMNQMCSIMHVKPHFIMYHSGLYAWQAVSPSHAKAFSVPGCSIG